MSEPAQLNFNHLSSMQDQMDFIDADTVCFFKLALIKSVPSDYESVHEFFTQCVYQLMKNQKKFSFSRLYSVFSFYSFRTQFIDLISEDLKKFRNRWLISHCHVIELEGLDTKASQHYFQTLEMKKTLEYISHFSSINNWIQSEYKKVRLQLLFSILKKNSSLVVFWSVVFIFFVIWIILAAKDNSFTISQQMKVLMHFIFGKN